TAKMMRELGVEVSATAGAPRYQDLLDAYVVDPADAAGVAPLGIPVTLAHTLMAALADREELARRAPARAHATAEATARMLAETSTPWSRSRIRGTPSGVSPACSTARGGSNWRSPCARTCWPRSLAFASSPASSW